MSKGDNNPYENHLRLLANASDPETLNLTFADFGSFGSFCAPRFGSAALKLAKCILLILQDSYQQDSSLASGEPQCYGKRKK